MHLIIAALGSIVTILWLLHRLAEMGIDLGGLNPWAWRRRRKWRNAYEANPIYAIESPMEATALLIAATAKADGDMSLDEKKAILAMFENDFHLSDRDAAALLTSSTHLLGTGLRLLVGGLEAGVGEDQALAGGELGLLLAGLGSLDLLDQLLLGGDTPPGIYAWAVAAGFSDRLLNNVMRRMEEAAAK